MLKIIWQEGFVPVKSGDINKQAWLRNPVSGFAVDCTKNKWQ